ncbi:hypothetical protein DU478_17615 [Thalassococcus profundi]|uniref:Uncharacterized protein n=1 Tax=Thalassococcus profundi TaxID=2282382 RepID=A0A369TI42_9RHOB|nr:hypothetical protein [Thalassococcus profundi]RDD65019.1 hypothetical protein DU478_17615 [Thalassococcus profundi]
MLTRASLTRRADEIAAPLTDHERIALGVTLIHTARHPSSWAAVKHAAQLVGHYGEGLMMDELRANEGALDLTPTVATTTHEQNGDRCSGGSDRAGQTRPRVSSSLRGAWRVFQRAEGRFSDSLAGDVLGGVCVFVAGIGLIIFAGALQ